MTEIFLACLVGDNGPDSHFERTIKNPIEEHEYNRIIWGINESTLKHKRAEALNKLINTGNNVWVILYPSKSNRVPYAICSLKEIKKRVLGPLISIDETNEERGWTNGTSSGKDDFTFDIMFKELYLLNEKAFDGCKFSGQNALSQLKKTSKSEQNVELLTKIEEDLPYIKKYATRIVCSK